MLIFDQLKKNDPQLQLLAVVVSVGLGLLFAGLWWVQIVNAAGYQQHLETQSFRSVRIPAPRGEILDRNGVVLAGNRPTYSVDLYLEDMSKAFERAGDAEVSRARDERQNRIATQEKALNRKFSRQERRQFALTADEKNSLRGAARYAVASNVVWQISQHLQQPLTLNESSFQHHYKASLALPFTVTNNLDPIQVARYEEQCTGDIGADLEIQFARFYPFGTTAAHVLGHLKYDDSSIEGEEAFFQYRLPDYIGVVGIESGYDKELHGHAGAKAVLVNNLGYRQTETMWDPVEPGRDVVLTIDLRIQQAAERALRTRVGADVRGAVVVMDVNTGDILALVSEPSYDPNKFISQISREDNARLNDPWMRPQINRATQENYAPGSIFKPIVGLACLEAGLNPAEKIYNPGYIKVGTGRPIPDLAAPGFYDFDDAIMHSCNTYFITVGLRAGIENILRLGRRLHLGERTGLPTRQDVGGAVPGLQRAGSRWFDGNTANICIGQGELAVTPMQMAVMTAAIANGGKVLWPRLADRVEPAEPGSGEKPIRFPSARVRDDLGVRARNLEILRLAMLKEVEEGGTGTKAMVPGMQICGKTGTAQVKDEHNRKVGDTMWFISFAPYDQPRYAVVVMAEGGVSQGTGGSTCAPVAGDIYRAIRQYEGASNGKSLAGNN